MPVVGNNINTCKPSDEDSELVHVVVHTMKEMVVIIHKNELVGQAMVVVGCINGHC